MKNIQSQENLKSLKHSLRWISYALLLVSLISSALFYTSVARGQESAISEEQIQENLKQRLEQTLEGRSEALGIKRAWVGDLESIANNTLTIETRNGPKLASVSAETSFVRLPGRENIDQDDLEIGSHTIAMGIINGKKVLETKRVAVYDSAPETPTRSVNWITIGNFDLDSLELSFEFGQEQQSIAVAENSILTASQDNQIVEVEVESIADYQNAVIITETVEDKISLLRLHLIPANSQDSPENSTSKTEAGEAPH